MELKSIIDALEGSEWSSLEAFMDLVDIESSTLMASLYTDNTFSEYNDGQIQSAVMEAIEEYIDVDYFKHG